MVAWGLAWLASLPAPPDSLLGLPFQASTDQGWQECSVQETGGICHYPQRPRIMALWEELSNMYFLGQGTDQADTSLWVGGDATCFGSNTRVMRSL